MRATEFIDYINRKKKPSKEETDLEYYHLSIEYEDVIKDGKMRRQLTKKCQKYEDARKRILKQGEQNEKKL